MKNIQPVKISINVRKPEDLSQVVVAVNKSIAKAGRHGLVSVEIVAPDGSKLDDNLEDSPGSSAKELKAAKKAHVETINELTQARQAIAKLEAQQQASQEASKARVDDSGSQNDRPLTAAEKKAAAKAAKA